MSPLKTGTLTTLRIDDSQGTGLLRCDPDYSNGQAFDGFLNGCKPWYGANSFVERDVVEHDHEVVSRAPVSGSTTT